jgi:spermidine/putrescine transport system permease protein
MNFVRNLMTEIDKKPAAKAYILFLPFMVAALFLMLIPMITVVEKSLHPLGQDFTILKQFTIDNYVRVFSPQYLPVFLRSLEYALITTVLCLVIGYPLAYYIAMHGGKRKTFFILLIMLPFWTSYLIRTYAWIVLLRTEGVINSILMALHTIQQPVQFLNTPFAVVLGLTYGFLPFMTLPLYVSLEKLGKSLVEASLDLGAKPIRTFLNVIFPLSLPGVVAGALLTFIPCMGDFVTADILGGPKTIMIGNLIQLQFIESFDWPFGSALSFILMSAMLLSIFGFVKAVGAKNV